jgi:hypothetical protein
MGGHWLEELRRISAAGPEPLPIPVDEAIDLTRRMRACLHRSVEPGCGCAGARCALQGGAAVTHLDCFDCLRRAGSSPGGRW